MERSKGKGKKIQKKGEEAKVVWYRASDNHLTNQLDEDANVIIIQLIMCFIKD